jgi:micrococcal nuclease
MYEYKCVTKRIIDGDSVVVDIDLGFDTWIFDQVIRLSGIDAPEIRTKDLEEKEAGYNAKEFVEKHLPIGMPALLMSRKYNGEKGKYGRIVGDFKVYDSMYDSETTLCKLLLRYGLAEEYIV